MSEKNDINILEMTNLAPMNVKWTSGDTEYNTVVLIDFYNKNIISFNNEEINQDLLVEIKKIVKEKVENPVNVSLPTNIMNDLEENLKWANSKRNF
jgi:hypothetical protein